MDVSVNPMEDKKISVIIPVFNNARFLEQCLNSVRTQDYDNLEIICVDDGSADDTPAILSRIENADNRVKIITHEVNRGRLEARRTGVENASGDYLMFLDSDDTYDRCLCSTALHSIQDADVDIVQFSARRIDIETKSTDIVLPPVGTVNRNGIFNHIFITKEIPVSLVMKIFRAGICKKAYREIPELSCNMGEDILVSFFISWFASSLKGVRTRAKYNYYYGRGISSGVQISLEKFRNYCEMSQISAVIMQFLEKEKADSSLTSIAEKLNIRLLADCCTVFDLVPDEDKAQAVDMFWNYWGPIPDLNKYLLYAFADQKRFMDSIYNSNSYRLGNSIVAPLKKIKSYIG